MIKKSKKQVLYVATFAGEFLAISYQTGEILWKLNDKFDTYCEAQYCVDEQNFTYEQSNQVNESIFKSKNSSDLLFENNKDNNEKVNKNYKKRSNSNVQNEYMVPSIDGLIYHFVDNNFRIMNDHNRNLENIFLDSKNKVRTVSRLLLIGLDPLTGYIYYECNGDACKYSKSQYNETDHYMNHINNSDSTMKDILAIECQIFRRINSNLINGKINWNITHNLYQLRYFDQEGYCHDLNYLKNEYGSNDYSNFIKYDAIYDIIENKKYKWKISLNSPIVGLWFLETNGKLEKINIRSLIYFSQPKNIINKILFERKLNEDSLIIFTFNGQPYFVPIVNIFETFNNSNFFATIYTISGVSDKYTNNDILKNSLKKFDYSNQLYKLQSQLKLDKRNSFYKIKSYNFSDNSLLPSYDINRQLVVSTQKPKSNYSFFSLIGKFIHLFKCFVMFGTAITLIYNTTYTYGRKLYDYFRLNPEDSPLTLRKGSISESERLNDNQIVNNDKKSDVSQIMISRYMSDFTHIKKLGKGGFGHVYMAKNIIDDCEYAIKRIRLPECRTARPRVMREVQALAKLNHPGIVRFYNAWFEPTLLLQKNNKNKQIPLCPFIQNDSDLSNDSDLIKSSFSTSIISNDLIKSYNPFIIPNDYNFENELDSFERDNLNLNLNLSETHDDTFESSTKDECLVSCNHDIFSDLFIQMQLCKSETLHDWLMANTVDRDISLCLLYFKQLLEAISFIHSKNFIHRDLKPSNIFFSMDGHIKIGDFGLVTHTTFPSTKYQKQNTENNNKKTSDNQNSKISVSCNQNKVDIHYYTKRVGTELYMAPEQVIL